MLGVYYSFFPKNRRRSVMFYGLDITLERLKSMIMLQERLKNCDLQITNEKTHEEYTDDEELIPRNTSVIVRSVPKLIVDCSDTAVVGSSRPKDSSPLMSLAKAVNNFKNETGYTKHVRKQVQHAARPPPRPLLSRPLHSRQQDPLLANVTHPPPASVPTVAPQSQVQPPAAAPTPPHTAAVKGQGVSPAPAPVLSNRGRGDHPPAQLHTAPPPGPAPQVSPPLSLYMPPPQPYRPPYTSCLIPSPPIGYRHQPSSHSRSFPRSSYSKHNERSYRRSRSRSPIRFHGFRHSGSPQCPPPLRAGLWEGAEGQGPFRSRSRSPGGFRSRSPSGQRPPPRELALYELKGPTLGGHDRWDRERYQQRQKEYTDLTDFPRPRSNSRSPFSGSPYTLSRTRSRSRSYSYSPSQARSRSRSHSRSFPRSPYSRHNERSYRRSRSRSPTWFYGYRHSGSPQGPPTLRAGPWGGAEGQGPFRSRSCSPGGFRSRSPVGRRPPPQELGPYELKGPSPGGHDRWDRERYQQVLPRDYSPQGRGRRGREERGAPPHHPPSSSSSGSKSSTKVLKTKNVKKKKPREEPEPSQQSADRGDATPVREKPMDEIPINKTPPITSKPAPGSEVTKAPTSKSVAAPVKPSNKTASKTRSDKTRKEKGQKGNLK